MTLRLHLLLLLGLVLPSVAGAQLTGPYRLDLGDTLTYRETTSTTVTLEPPRGEVVAGSTHDAVIEMISTEPGIVTAWFAELSVGSSGPSGDLSPATDPLLNEPYRLRISDAGDVETDRAPEAPAEIQAITDLSQQFFDFFIRVPAQRPEAGATWSDTLTSTGSPLPETTHDLRAIRSYTARGDTTVEGVQAQIIETVTTVELESTSPMAGQAGLTATTILDGRETGTAFFDWDGGWLVGRERLGELGGILRINAPEPVEIPQTMTYESRIVLPQSG